MLVVFYIVDLTNVTAIFNFATLGQIFLVCTLPLSALWASADAEGRKPELPSFANVSGTNSVNSGGVARFHLFSRGKKSSQDSHSSYSTDIEKTPEYRHDGVTSLHVPAADSDKRG
jgi:hypothetical protein